MTPLTSLRQRLRNCRGVIVDSSVVLDVLMGDPTWYEWSSEALSEIAGSTIMVINPIVFAEVSIGFPTIEALEIALPPALYRREPLPWEASFLAGKCYLNYRRRGGARTSHLPDFYIGAHAAVAGLGVLTRDTARYRTYFPTVEVFAP